MEVIHTKQSIKDLSKLKSNPAIAIKYKLWEETVEDFGPLKLREIPAYDDKALEGNHKMRRSRLSRGFRVFYRIIHKSKIEICEVNAVNNHDYKKITRKK